MSTINTEGLLADLLQKPVPTYVKKQSSPSFTNRLEISGSDASVEIQGEPETVDETLARRVLLERGEDPDQWVATHFESSDREMSSGQILRSSKFKFARKGTRSAQLAQAQAEPELNLDEIVSGIASWEPKPVEQLSGEHGFIVALGDMQFGKIDGDGVAGTLRRTIDYLNASRENLDRMAELYDIGHIHVAWLGDHVEAFVSQGGANVWRTPLTLNEQIRLTRRVMLHALELFAGTADRVSFAAVPGNHGESVRFHGKGVTRYDDSHDTESLIAVSDAAALNVDKFGGVEFYVPQTDEMTVVLDVAGTTVGHVHGHQWRPNKHEAWWQGQGFGGSNLQDADLLLAGHLHHLHVQAVGRRTFIQVPALESESTWWRHATGTIGNPGLLNVVTKNGVTSRIEVVQGG